MARAMEGGGWAGITAVCEGISAVPTTLDSERAAALVCFASFKFWSPVKSFWFDEARVATAGGRMQTMGRRHGCGLVRSCRSCTETHLPPPQLMSEMMNWV